MPGNIRVRDYHFWLPLVAMFTGAGLTEMCQLEPMDIRQGRGIWFFEFTTRTDEHELQDEKSLKKPGSHRQVPVHHVLIQLGFVDWMKQQKGRRGLLFENAHAEGL